MTTRPPVQDFPAPSAYFFRSPMRLSRDATGGDFFPHISRDGLVIHTQHLRRLALRDAAFDQLERRLVTGRRLVMPQGNNRHGGVAVAVAVVVGSSLD
jgi:hypothetical protein